MAGIVAERFERSVLVEGDAFFGFLRRGAIQPWLPAAKAQNTAVIEAAASAAGHYSRSGFFVVYDGVVGPWFLPAFLAATGLDELDYLILLPTVDRCVARVVTRTGHGFTDEGATRHMHKEFSSARIDQRHVLADPPEDVEAVAGYVLQALATGSLRVLHKP